VTLTGIASLILVATVLPRASLGQERAWSPENARVTVEDIARDTRRLETTLRSPGPATKERVAGALGALETQTGELLRALDDLSADLQYGKTREETQAKFNEIQTLKWRLFRLGRYVEIEEASTEIAAIQEQLQELEEFYAK